MFVRDAMTRRPVTVRPRATVKEALARLDDHGITSMPVVDTDDQLIGVLSEADLLRGGVPHDARAHLAPGREPDAVQPPAYVEDVMTRQCVYVSEDTDLASAVELMTDLGVKSLPVLDDRHRPVGMISRRDVVHGLARADAAVEADIDELFRRLGVSWTVTVEEGNVTVDGPVDIKARQLAVGAIAGVAGVRSVRLVG